MSSLVSSRSTSQYTDEQRREAIANYAVLGNCKRVAEQQNIPRKTLSQWLKTDWGIELLASIRHETADEMDAKLSTIVVKALNAIEDRVDNGDVKLDRDGGQVRVPVGAKDLSVIMGVGYDKMRIGRNQATSISTNSSALDNIAKRLEELAKAEKGKLIEGEWVVESDT